MSKRDFMPAKPGSTGVVLVPERKGYTPPAPWTARVDGFEATILDAEGHTVARGIAFHSVASLVAAAPELLEALKMARDELLQPCCSVCGWDPEHRREDDPRTWHNQQGCEIEDAIAKAEEKP